MNTPLKIKAILFVTICLWANLAFAHTINYSNVVLHHWSIAKENKTIDGSFYMYKNGNVYIEDASNKIFNYPLADFSKDDQAFAMKKQAWVIDMNKKLQESITLPDKAQSPFDIKFWIVVLILAGVAVYSFFFAEKKKRKYLIPIMSVGTVMTLFSFTDRKLHFTHTKTNPLTIDSAYAPFKPAIYTTWDTNYFYVDSKGIPSHVMMAGIISWQRQVPIPQCYIDSNAWSIPLHAVVSSSPIKVDSINFTRGAIAVAVNGVPIFNEHTNTGADAYATGQLDSFGGHCGRADDYHYHIAPMVLYKKTKATLPVAYALDGFAVYGNVEPDGSPMQPLDSNHGHFWTNGIYHYHGTTTYPYMIGYMVGKVTQDTTHQIVPQAQASPIRGPQNPLAGAVITNCVPNDTNNGYTLTYTDLSKTDSIVYYWNTAGFYTFHYYTATGDSNQTFHGHNADCTVPTSVSEVSEPVRNFMVYPNPTNNEFTIQLGTGVSNNDVKEISIYNINGDLIYNSAHYNQTINMANMAKGMYLIRINISGDLLTQKLIVQ